MYKPHEEQIQFMTWKVLAGFVIGFAGVLMGTRIGGVFYGTIGSIFMIIGLWLMMNPGERR